MLGFLPTEAVGNIVKFLGMHPCERSDKVPENKNTHTLLLAGKKHLWGVPGCFTGGTPTGFYCHIFPTHPCALVVLAGASLVRRAAVSVHDDPAFLPDRWSLKAADL